MKKIVLILATIVLLLGATGARADSFNFSFSGSPLFGGTITGSGTFTTNPLSGGTYLVTAITGTATLTGAGSPAVDVTNAAMALYTPSFAGTDNLLYPNAPYVGNGIGFTINGETSGGSPILFAIYNKNGSAAADSPSDSITESLTFTVTPAPEPSSAVLLGIGLAGLLGLVFFRKRSVSSVTQA